MWMAHAIQSVHVRSFANLVSTRVVWRGIQWRELRKRKIAGQNWSLTRPGSPCSRIGSWHDADREVALRLRSTERLDGPTLKRQSSCATNGKHRSAWKKESASFVLKKFRPMKQQAVATSRQSIIGSQATFSPCFLWLALFPNRVDRWQL
jgi:hypothetical protein